ncbi:hypothetical protein PF003_g23893 [Phytophthora fragariae]|nr:hypothetical protein PF003_g23893 [Phytophthora fragariae]
MEMVSVWRESRLTVTKGRWKFPRCVTRFLILMKRDSCGTPTV